MTDAEVETLNMELLEGCPSEKELWKMAIDLLAEVKRLKEDRNAVLEAAAEVADEYPETPGAGWDLPAAIRKLK